MSFSKVAKRRCAPVRPWLTPIKAGLQDAGLDPAAVQLLTTREETRALLELDGYVDLIIPRGSNAFVRFVQDNTPAHPSFGTRRRHLPSLC